MLSTFSSVVAQLNEELIGWLTTVTEAGQPQASPVWHIIDNDDLMIFSRPKARRLKNIRTNPKVAYNLRGDFPGDTIVTMEGRAAVDEGFSTPLGTPDYLNKYSEEMVRLGWSPEEYDQEFSVAVRITITRVRAEPS